MRIGFLNQLWQGSQRVVGSWQRGLATGLTHTRLRNAICRSNPKPSGSNKERMAMERARLPWKLNTSNPAKMADFEQLFDHFGLTKPRSTQFDLREIQADPISVAVHKASQLENYTLVEDTALHIEGEQIGVQIRWLIATLPQYEGKAANLVTLLAYRENSHVYIYEGNVPGKIVAARGPLVKGFEINPYFQPDKQPQTLAEFASNEVNPRFLAFQQFVLHQPHAVHPVITSWQGKWQQEEHVAT